MIKDVVYNLKKEYSGLQKCLDHTTKKYVEGDNKKDNLVIHDETKIVFDDTSVKYAPIRLLKKVINSKCIKKLLAGLYDKQAEIFDCVDIIVNKYILSDENIYNEIKMVLIIFPCGINKIIADYVNVKMSFNYLYNVDNVKQALLDDGYELQHRIMVEHNEFQILFQDYITITKNKKPTMFIHNNTFRKWLKCALENNTEPNIKNIGGMTWYVYNNDTEKIVTLISKIIKVDGRGWKEEKLKQILELHKLRYICINLGDTTGINGLTQEDMDEMRYVLMWVDNNIDAIYSYYGDIILKSFMRMWDFD